MKTLAFSFLLHLAASPVLSLLLSPGLTLLLPIRVQIQCETIAVDDNETKSLTRFVAGVDTDAVDSKGENIDEETVEFLVKSEETIIDE